MELWKKIVTEYPELADNEYAAFGVDGTVRLQDDSDGKGAYISKWEYSKPVPEFLQQYVQ
jgi:hypothetical protein